MMDLISGAIAAVKPCISRMLARKKIAQKGQGGIKNIKSRPFSAAPRNPKYLGAKESAPGAWLLPCSRGMAAAAVASDLPIIGRGRATLV
jgi:hypothetical protein